MKFIVSCTFLIIGFAGFSQNCSEKLHVNIKDVHTGEGVPNAKLIVNGSQLTADSAGNVVLSDLCKESFVLTCIPHFGCEPVETIVEYPFDTLFVFIVETHAEELDEQIVTAYRFNRDSRAIIGIDATDLQSVRGNTLGDQVERVPGVTSLRTGSNIVKPMINGLHSNRIVVMNNGIRQEGQQWGSEHAPEIDPNLSNSVSVIQGASGLEYGPDAIGGVIIVEPEELRYNSTTAGWAKISGNSNGKAASAAVLLNGSLFKSGNLAYRIHGSGRLNGTLSTPNYLMANTASHEYSFSGAVGYKTTRFQAEYFYSNFFTELGIFSGSHIGNLTDLQSAIAGSEPKYKGEFTYETGNPKQFVRHQLNKIKIGYEWNEKVQTTITTGYQFNLRQEFDTHKAYDDSIEALGLPDFELNLWTLTTDLVTSWRHNKEWKSKFGISLFSQDNAYSGRFFIPNFRKHQYGGFYLLDYTHGKWSAEGGIRYDRSDLQVFYYQNDELQNPEKAFGNFSGSIGFSRLLGHHWNVRMNAGTAWRPPSVNELYSKGLHHGAAAIENGNDQLKQEQSFQLQTGVHYRSRFAELEISAYVNKMNGFISLIPSFPPQLTIVGAFPVFGYRQFDAILSGINVSGDLRINKFLNYIVRGSFMNAVNVSNDSLLYGIPYNRLSNSLRTNLKINEKWTFHAEAEIQSVMKRVRTSFIPDYSADPAGYVLLNASAGFDYLSKRKQKIQFILSGTNLTNVRYRDYLNRFRYYADELGTNISATIRIPFEFKSQKTTL